MTEDRLYLQAIMVPASDECRRRLTFVLLLLIAFPRDGIFHIR